MSLFETWNNFYLRFWMEFGRNANMTTTTAFQCVKVIMEIEVLIWHAQNAEVSKSFWYYRCTELTPLSIPVGMGVSEGGTGQTAAGPVSGWPTQYFCWSPNWPTETFGPPNIWLTEPHAILFGGKLYIGQVRRLQFVVCCQYTQLTVKSRGVIFTDSVDGIDPRTIAAWGMWSLFLICKMCLPTQAMFTLSASN
jgi:hypothetical protein